MFLYVFSALNSNQFGEVLGIILSILEVLTVALVLISFFVPPESKFGKFLSHILVGLYKAQEYLQNLKKKEEEEDKDHDNNSSDQ